MASDTLASPNHGERAGGRQPDMIVLHYTGMPSAKDALTRLCTQESQVSAHYFVFEDGRVIQMVPESRRAWHAGESAWGKDTDINSCSIGIEIAHPGHEPDYPPFPDRQMAAVATLCRGIIVRRVIPQKRVLAHSDVAPSRKKDPGEKFPWQFLHRAGVGHWVEPMAISDGPEVKLGETGAVVSTVKSLFGEYGYKLSDGEVFDEEMRDVVIAFQRHFRPEKVDGIVDPSTLLTMRRLLDALPENLALMEAVGDADADAAPDVELFSDEPEPAEPREYQEPRAT